MTLAELGAQLKEERIAQGLMVEDVATQLKVPTRILRAIEEGNINDLPHSVYTRGFIKGYAKIMGYPDDTIIGLIDGLEDLDDEYAAPKPVQTRPMNEPMEQKSGKGFGWLLKIIILALLAGGGYFYYTYTFKGNEVSSFLPGYTPPAETVAPAEASGQAGASADSSDIVWPDVIEGEELRSSSDQTSPAQSSLPDSGVSSSDTPSLPASSTPAEPLLAEDNNTATQNHTGASAEAVAEIADESAPVSTNIPARAGVSMPDTVAPAAVPPAGSTTETAPSTPSRPIGSSETVSVSGGGAEAPRPGSVQQIVLTATADCWIHANADNGSDTREFSLKSGETFAMPFKDKLVLKLGNAGGVKINYNGRSMPAAGTLGQVKTITFPPGN